MAKPKLRTWEIPVRRKESHIGSGVVTITAFTQEEALAKLRAQEYDDLEDVSYSSSTFDDSLENWQLDPLGDVEEV